MLRLWFSFDVPVGRRTYALNGAGLMTFKYAVDATLIWAFTRVFWSPFDYLLPLWSVRQEVLQHAPTWLSPGLLVMSLPFLWIGVSMSMRRAADAGLSPWLALLFFVPILNYGLMAALSLYPSRPRLVGPAMPQPQVDHRLQSALLGVAASIAITLVTVAIGVYFRRAYSTGLFLGVPFTIGYISSYIYNQRLPHSVGESVILALASATIAGGTLVVFALEGIVCVAMAVPLAGAVAIPGAVLGRIVAQRGAEPASGPGAVALLVPLLVAVEPHQTPDPREVVTVVEIDAPPPVVWEYVVAFPELEPAREWPFRAGIAAPVGARIEGSGVGAVRYCDFTTGVFVEPITGWQENQLLAFAVTAQATPLRELSPYRDVPAPHLNDYFRATYGEFRLTELPGGRTRLMGLTRYEMDMFPQRYWGALADEIVEAIHLRVLRHIRELAEHGRRSGDGLRDRLEVAP